MRAGDESFFAMNPKSDDAKNAQTQQAKETQNLLHTHAPDRPEVRNLSEKEKKEIELSGEAEHARGTQNEAEKAEQLDSEREEK